MAVETKGRARSFQVVAIHARKRAWVRPAGSTRGQRSSAASVGSCGPSASHVRRQRVASLALPRPKTFRKGNQLHAMPECCSRKPLVGEATHADTKRTQERAQQGRSHLMATTTPWRCGV